jgi:hypothetical protein
MKNKVNVRIKQSEKVEMKTGTTSRQRSHINSTHIQTNKSANEVNHLLYVIDTFHHNI